ncbi:VWA domain-containing protein [Candidatus Chloroploca sp. M-50]|uniref:VWA domain-containing protein n=1 Tax=Candidatus Chloroploca mongolica TaxID=2528176 RepID=A0ABS4DFW5_9CHLR|nr:VWA domain-containing protein [Candidatus Chloroploca mongolica]MBP1468315.1 VWA domain-containing protein [Candidatus Chloroploca mongolica]
MSAFQTTDFVITLFLALRQQGLVLGVGELLAVLDITDASWQPEADEQARLPIRLVWCHSPAEEQIFDDVWATTLARTMQGAPQRIDEHKPPPAPDDPSPVTPPEQPRPEALPPEPLPPTAAGAAARLEPLPFYVPFAPAPVDAHLELGSSWPITRRQMAYAWRYLRRPLADGPCDLLDLAATIDITTRSGIFLGPVYRRRERNHAHLVLLIDQNGSMMPFHRFTRDLATTAQDERSLEQVEVYYFHNVPAEHLATDPHLTTSIELAHLLERCTPETSILIASDAGAARGYRDPERIRATRTFVRQVEQHTLLLAWLNPMPHERWAHSSAQVIAGLLRGHMFQMDADGLSNAIDVLRGQPLRYH